MSHHPSVNRTLVVQHAQFTLERTLLSLQKEHDLTFLECCHILTQILATWLNRARQNDA